MAVTNGPNLGVMINAATGDTFDTDFRKLLRRTRLRSGPQTIPPHPAARGSSGPPRRVSWPTHRRIPRSTFSTEPVGSQRKAAARSSAK